MDLSEIQIGSRPANMEKRSVSAQIGYIIERFLREWERQRGQSNKHLSKMAGTLTILAVT